MRVYSSLPFRLYCMFDRPSYLVFFFTKGISSRLATLKRTRLSLFVSNAPNINALKPLKVILFHVHESSH